AEDDGVHHPDRLATGVEIQPQRERHPAARTLCMFAFDPDDGAHGACLLEHYAFDRAFEFLLGYLRIGRRDGAIAAEQDEVPVAQAIAALARDRRDEVGP